MSKISRIKEVLENWMGATAFAEAGEDKHALEFAGLPTDKREGSLDALTTAITFAEAGEHGMALEYLGSNPEKSIEEALDIPGLRIWFGTVAMEPEPAAIPGIRVWSGTVSA